MSYSLNINTPKVVQQNTPLRGVPSGSTATPDYSVKYVPQELTEEQQAQARQNIGAGTSNFSGSYDDLSDKPTIPAAQVQSDWNQSDTNAADYIKNKPTIPSAQVQSDWSQSDTNAADYIKNKPSESIELVMTDENGVVITGTFILSEKNIVEP